MQITVAGESTFVYGGGRGFEPALPAIVFIHGAGHDHSVWNLQCRYFAHHGWTVIAPDLPGHGRSQGAPPSSVEAAADWILALLDACNIRRAAVVGHSMGSLIALEAASRAPQRSAALCLVGSAIPMPVAPPLLAAAERDRTAAHAMINQWSFSAAAQMGASALPGQVQRNVNLRLMERQAPGVLHADLASCNAYGNGAQAAAAARCPTLMVCGERDLMTPAKASGPLREALAGVPGGLAVSTIAGCGHAIMAEAPDALTDALRHFLAKI